MFNFKKNVKKEMSKLWAEIYNNQNFKEITIKRIDGFDERFTGIADEIKQIEINYGDSIHNLEKCLNQLVKATNKIWEKQKEIEEREYKIIKVLEKMAEELDEETIKSVKNIKLKETYETDKKTKMAKK